MFASLFFASLLALNAAAATPEPEIYSSPKPPPAWLKRLDVGTPGTFLPPRPFVANYRITWLDVKAAQVEIKCATSEDGSEIQTKLKASTVGGARSLWQLDAYHFARSNRLTLRPIRFEQSDQRVKKHINSQVEFTPEGALRWNQSLTKDNNFAKPAPDSPEATRKPRSFMYPGLFDMHSAFLYLRSLPLAAGETHTVAVMSATNPYIITIKVTGRENVKVAAGRYLAIKCSLALEKIDKFGAVEAHKSFKSASIWVSDDSDRIVLKVAAQVFIGSVALELEKVTFPAEKAPR